MKRVCLLAAGLVLGACGVAPADTSDVGGGDMSPPPTSDMTDMTPAPDMGQLSCDPGEYQGDDAWTETLVVRPGDRLCAYAADFMPFDGDDIKRAIRLRGTIEPMPGTYKVPSMEGTEAFRLPMCVVDGGKATPMNVATSYKTGVGAFLSEPAGHFLRVTLPASEGGILLSLFRGKDDTSFSFAPATGDDSTFFHKEGASAVRGEGNDERLYAPCELPTNACSKLTGSGVDLTLDEYIWASSPGLGFAAGLRLRGTFDGKMWMFQGYEQISTIYARHAFGRSHFFRFEKPTEDGHCGLRVEVGQFFTTKGFVSYADCEGQVRGTKVELEEKTVDCE